MIEPSTIKVNQHISGNQTTIYLKKDIDWEATIIHDWEPQRKRLARIRRRKQIRRKPNEGIWSWIFRIVK